MVMTMKWMGHLLHVLHPLYTLQPIPHVHQLAPETNVGDDGNGNHRAWSCDYNDGVISDGHVNVIKLVMLDE